MESILIFIKHHFRFLWTVIEWFNSLVFKTVFNRKMQNIVQVVLKESSVPPLVYRRLYPSDEEALHNLIHSQPEDDLKYFNPHGFDIASIKKQFGNTSFLMLGVFDHEKIIGYFFLRFFMNRKCFVGRLIDKDFRGKGIGPVMNNIMYETAWRMKFHCLSTISRNNTAVMRAHAKNPTIIILKELPNNYLLVEFIKKT
jgi:hypothetical protein